jgi:hypothetical protein
LDSRFVPIKSLCSAASRVTQSRAKSLIPLIEWLLAPQRCESANAWWIKQLGDRSSGCPQSCPQQGQELGNGFPISNLAAIVEVQLCKPKRLGQPHP